MLQFDANAHADANVDARVNGLLDEEHIEYKTRQVFS